MNYCTACCMSWTAHSRQLTSWWQSIQRSGGDFTTHCGGEPLFRTQYGSTYKESAPHRICSEEPASFRVTASREGRAGADCKLPLRVVGAGAGIISSRYGVQEQGGIAWVTDLWPNLQGTQLLASTSGKLERGSLQNFMTVRNRSFKATSPINCGLFLSCIIPSLLRG